MARGTYAYALQDAFSAVAVDASDPTAPVAMSYLYANDIRDLALGAKYAYVAGGYDGLLVIDVGDTGAPTSAVETGAAPGFGLGAKGLFLDGTELLFADNGAGMVALDVTSDLPAFVSATTETWDSYDVVLEDGIAYVADGSAGLVLLEIGTDPYFTRIASASLPTTAYGVAVLGTYALVAADSWGLLVVDVDPASGLYVSQVADYSVASARDVAVSGKKAYVASGADGLVVLDLTDPKVPTLVGQYVDTAIDVYDVTLVGETAYASCGTDGIRILDISSDTPSLLGKFATVGAASGMTVIGSTGLVATTQGVELVDLTDASLPEAAGELDVGGAAQAIVSDGTRAYVAVPGVGIAVVDL